eukprot:scaffold107100_cov67-Phaeocystis_antarctica.AAC.2
MPLAISIKASRPAASWEPRCNAAPSSSLQPQRLQRLAAPARQCAAALLRSGASSSLPAVPDSHSSCEASSYLCDTTPSCDKWHGCGVTRCDGCSSYHLASGSTSSSLVLTAIPGRQPVTRAKQP